MSRALLMFVGGVVAIGLVVVALWAWFDAASLAADAANPKPMRWAARFLGVAAAAGAQVVALTFVVGRFHGSQGGHQAAHRAAHDALRLLAALVCSMSAAIAAVLGLAARS